MQIWSFHLLSGSKTIPWKFHILRTKNSRVIYPNKQTFHILGAFISKSKQCYNAEFLLLFSCEDEDIGRFSYNFHFMAPFYGCGSTGLKAT